MVKLFERSSLFFLALGLAITVGCVKTGGDNEENVTYAVVNGKEIKGKDVLDKIKNDLAEIQRNSYEIKRRATEEMVQQRILEDEAKKQNTTLDKLFAQFDSLKEQDVKPDDIKMFLKQR